MRRVRLPGRAGTARHSDVVVTVLDAETDASGTVTLQAAWTLQSGQPARATLTQQATLKAALENRGAAALR